MVSDVKRRKVEVSNVRGGGTDWQVKDCPLPQDMATFTNKAASSNCSLWHVVSLSF